MRPPSRPGEVPRGRIRGGESLPGSACANSLVGSRQARRDRDRGGRRAAGAAGPAEAARAAPGSRRCRPAAADRGAAPSRGGAAGRAGPVAGSGRRACASLCSGQTEDADTGTRPLPPRTPRCAGHPDPTPPARKAAPSFEWGACAAARPPFATRIGIRAGCSCDFCSPAGRRPRAAADRAPCPGSGGRRLDRVRPALAKRPRWSRAATFITHAAISRPPPASREAGALSSAPVAAGRL
jgi:hypothetical protein